MPRYTFDFRELGHFWIVFRGDKLELHGFADHGRLRGYCHVYVAGGKNLERKEEKKRQDKKRSRPARQGMNRIIEM